MAQKVAVARKDNRGWCACCFDGQEGLVANVKNAILKRRSRHAIYSFHFHYPASAICWCKLVLLATEDCFVVVLFTMLRFVILFWTTMLTNNNVGLFH